MKQEKVRLHARRLKKASQPLIHLLVQRTTLLNFNHIVRSWPEAGPAKALQQAQVSCFSRIEKHQPHRGLVLLFQAMEEEIVINQVVQ